MMMIVLLTVEADSQTEVGQSRHEARLLHFLNSLLHYLTRLFAGRIPSLFQPLQRILDDNYANVGDDFNNREIGEVGGNES